MDIECPTCGEPWEVEHMRHDEPHEWNLSDQEVDDLLQTGAFSGPEDARRQAAAAAGWDFASNSLLSFIRCPNCKDAPGGPGFVSQIAADRRRAVALVAELLEGDEDGMAAILQDLPAMLAAAA
jgi:hypothetical protein